MNKISTTKNNASLKEISLKEGIILLHNEYGMTLSEIGKLLGVTVRTVENYQKGQTKPKTYEKYYDLCETIVIELKNRPMKIRKKNIWTM